MGCVSSKILTRSGSFNEEVKHSLQRVNGIEGLLATKNGGDQFLALLCTANTVAQKLKASSTCIEPKRNKKASPELVMPKPIDLDTDPQDEAADIETINTWELLAGLEEGSGEELHSTSGCMVESEILDSSEENESKSFRTIEEFDAMVTRNQLSGHSKSSIEECKINSENPINVDTVKSNLGSETGYKRKAMAKELGVLKVQGFKFSKSGSLRDWHLQGGQVSSPGSYVTPKFGNFASSRAEGAVFDPEMVSHFEQAMKELTVEEDCILQQIVHGLEGGKEEM